MWAVVAWETPLLITAGQPRITAAALQTVRITLAQAGQLTRRVRLAPIRIGRLPLTKVAHTISAAILYRRSNAVTRHRHVHTPHRNSALTLRRRVPLLHRAARTRRLHTPRPLLAADLLEGDDLPVAVAEIEAAQDRTAGKAQHLIQGSATRTKKPAGFERAFVFFRFVRTVFYS
jgi:hypothetical protein